MNRIAFFGVVAATATGLAGCNASASKGAYVYETAAVDKGDVARIVSASGAVRALTTVEVGSQVSGKIVELDVDYNSKVKKDQVLARIDPQTFETNVRSAQANLMQAESAVASAKSAITKAEVTLTNTKQTWERQNNLFAQGAIAQQAKEQSDRDYAIAKADVEVNKAALQSAVAALAQRRAALESAKLDLSRTYIRSPIDGVVIDRVINVGQTVQASLSAPKFFIIAQDLSDIRIDASVVESDIGGIDETDAVSFTVDAFPGERFQGKVDQVRLNGTEVANVVTYPVVVAARNPSERLRPGMTANVEIVADRATGALRIPTDATRFQPPKEVQDKMKAAQAQGGAGAGGPPGGGGGFGGGRSPVNEWLKDIGIDDKRIEKISGEIRAEFQKNMPAPGPGGPGGGGFGPPSPQQGAQIAAMRQKMQGISDGIMKRNLSPQEYEAYQKRRAEGQRQKRATVYALKPDGSLERKTVVVGVADSDHVQILRGANEGDKFVVRVKAPAK